MMMMPIVLLVAASLVSSTVALGMCDNKIINNISKCYKDGNPPPQKLFTGKSYSVRSLTSDLITEDVKDAVGIEQETKWIVTRYLVDGSNKTVEWLTVHSEDTQDHLVTRDAAYAVKYRLYMLLNSDNIVSYYQCIDSDSANYEGKPELNKDNVHLGLIWEGPTSDCTSNSKTVYDEAKKCFSALGISVTDMALHKGYGCPNA